MKWQTTQFTINDSPLIRNSHKHMTKFLWVPQFFVASIVLIPIFVFNKYVFVESNAIFLLPLLLIAIFTLQSPKIPKGIIFPSIAFVMAILICYMWLRSGNLTTPRVVDVDFALQYSSFYDIGHQLLFYALFVLAAVYCYNKGGINLTLWLIILGYTIAFMARNTMQLDELKVGYNLSPGFVLFSLVPFLFLGRLQDNKKTGIFIHIFFWLCTIWTFLIGARTAMFSMLIFYGCMAAWPLISCNKKIYYTTFVGTLMFIFGIVTTYLLIIISGLAENLETLSVAIFDKSLFTRFKLWYFLSQIIAERPILGFGTENASTSFIAPKILFPLRENLSAHSTYLEILIRLGFVGLILYLCVLFGIWKILWQGRGENAVRVAGSFLIASLFFMSTGEYLIFGMELRSAFGWIILGIGAGACLQNKNRVNCTLK